ncbi:TetR/AcrR family transcriptional regulator C-terminal domain-containing protein [uncultured Enterococcus sp.]|uniref:TetR/AcrR family transcriptional regulator n=1 Tax=uncultured Enterococcus sp. TaxID=167972 RepID=UPI002AA72573|nr:TetR/AcrR family transcriptional regulator C-terminal domain-containing protein [uncultured Enterococcus sp.]
MSSVRNTETKARIKKAFTLLLVEKGIEGLTVSDITRTANINRGTFYLHYLDKYDLLSKIEADILSRLQKIFNTYGNTDDPMELIPYEAILEALHYVLTEFELIKALIGEGGDKRFIDTFKELIEETIQHKIEKSDFLTCNHEGLPKVYAHEILLSSIVSVILLWINRDAEESPEEIAAIINQTKQLSPITLLR